MRSAVIGCGAVAGTHLTMLGDLPDVTVVAVCDVDVQAARDTADRFGIPATYETVEALLDRERPDAVHVLTPPATHLPVTRDALRAGAHVLVEKPMALDVADADEMIGLARHHRRSLAVCHNFLFDPAVVVALELAESGRLGRLLSVDLYWSAYRDGRPDRYAEAEWMRRLPGGPVHELAPHAVYLLQAFLGRLDLLDATLTRHPDLPPPSGEAHLLFSGQDALGSAFLSLTSRPYTLVLRVHGTEGSVAVDAVRNVATVQGIPVLAQEEPAPSVPNPGHHALIGRFYECLAAGEAPPVSPEEGRDAVAVLDRVWPAMRRVGAGLRDAL